MNDRIDTSPRTRISKPGLVLLAVVAFLGVLAMSCGGKADAQSASSSTSAATTSAAKASIDVPSRSALMICSPGIRLIVEKTLGLAELPPISTSWTDHLYTCNYNLDGGPVVLSVKELPDAASAQQYLTGLSQHLSEAQPLVGIASLGLSGYQTASGVVIFAKDNMTLEVDASAMADSTKPDQLSKAGFAYQIATNILACWSGE